MKAFLLTLALLLCVALAAEHGWLFFSSDSQHLTAGINREVVRRDSAKIVDTVQNAVAKVEEKVDQSLETKTPSEQDAKDGEREVERHPSVQANEPGGRR